MHKKIILIFLLLTLFLSSFYFLPVAFSLDNNTQYPPPFDKINNRLEKLEDKADCYSSVLQAQRDMNNYSVTVIITIFLFFAGLTYVYNFRGARKYVKNSLASFKKELDDQIGKIKMDTMVSSGKLLEDYSEKFESKIENLKGYHYDALGRLYLEQNQHSVAFVWFVRAYRLLCKYLSKRSLNIILDNINDCLSKMTFINNG